MVKLLLLGASGSIGKQTLDVIKKHPSTFSLVGFSVGKNVRYISLILRRFKEIKDIYLIDDKKKKYYQKKYPSIHFYSGDNGLEELINHSNFDMLVNALVGFVGMKPTILAIKKNVDIALANKESLVVAGDLINNLLKTSKSKIYPIDSEHSAIYKCLKVDNKDVDKLILTASGGAFRNKTYEELKSVTLDDALNHPTWKMGAKITIDSATMVNKAFEIIEAHYLFNYPYEKIDVLLHDESHIHSLVKYHNGLYRADISKPDMRGPIKCALFKYDLPFKTYISSDYHNFNHSFHFKNFDIKRYPLVEFAKVVLTKKGNSGAIFNAANEGAVSAFLNKQIKFLDIEYIIHYCMNKVEYISSPSLEELIYTHQITLKMVHQLIKELRK